MDDLKSDLVPAIRIVEVARCHTKGPASEIEEALPLLVKALPNLSELWYVARTELPSLRQTINANTITGYTAQNPSARVSSKRSMNTPIYRSCIS